jgi:signal transduction histidine kinase
VDRAEGPTARGVAHDLRNLLTAITGHAELARDALPRDHAVRADLDEVLLAAGRAQALSEVLLDGGQRDAAPSPPLDALVRDALPLLQAVVGRGVAIVLELAAPEPVRSSRLTLERVLLNLAINAREAMDGSGRLTIATSRLTPATMEIRVSDSGPGFSALALDHLFEPGFTTRGDGGSHGLGLATSRELVASVGGRLEVEGEAVMGAVVRVLLPRA